PRCGRPEVSGPDAPGHRHREYPPWVDLLRKLLEARMAHQLIHLRLGAAAHDPGPALAVGQDAGNELDLRMPRLIGVKEQAARSDSIGEAVEGAKHRFVVGEQLIEAGDYGDGGPRRDRGQRRAIKSVAV